MKRKTIKTKNRILTLDSERLFEKSTIDDVISAFQEMKESLSEYNNLKFEIEYDGDNSWVKLYNHVERLETDAEYNRRLAREAKQQEKEHRLKEKEKTAEFKQYLKLKEKFENSVV